LISSFSFAFAESRAWLVDGRESDGEDDSQATEATSEAEAETSFAAPIPVAAPMTLAVFSPVRASVPLYVSIPLGFPIVAPIPVAAPMTLAVFSPVRASIPLYASIPLGFSIAAPITVAAPMTLAVFSPVRASIPLYAFHPLSFSIAAPITVAAPMTLAVFSPVRASIPLYAFHPLAAYFSEEVSTPSLLREPPVTWEIVTPRNKPSATVNVYNKVRFRDSGPPFGPGGIFTRGKALQEFVALLVYADHVLTLHHTYLLCRPITDGVFGQHECVRIDNCCATKRRVHAGEWETLTIDLRKWAGYIFENHIDNFNRTDEANPAFPGPRRLRERTHKPTQSTTKPSPPTKKAPAKKAPSGATVTAKKTPIGKKAPRTMGQLKVILEAKGNCSFSLP
jgi:hypothetical protein